MSIPMSMQNAEVLTIAAGRGWRPSECRLLIKSKRWRFNPVFRAKLKERATQLADLSFEVQNELARRENLQHIETMGPFHPQTTALRFK